MIITLALSFYGAIFKGIITAFYILLESPSPVIPMDPHPRPTKISWLGVSYTSSIIANLRYRTHFLAITYIPTAKECKR